MAFISHHAVSNEVLFSRSYSSKAELQQLIQALARQQQDFAQHSIQNRTGYLLALAEQIQRNKDKLAYQICIEVGRCLRECEAELNKSIALIRYYAHLAPELLAHKTIATQASFSQVRIIRFGRFCASQYLRYVPVMHV